MSSDLFDQVREREERERKAWEAETVVGTNGETIADFRRLFDAVADAGHWKNPFRAEVPLAVGAATKEAVAFFHADRPRVVDYDPITDMVTLEGRGYQG